MALFQGKMWVGYKAEQDRDDHGRFAGPGAGLSDHEGVLHSDRLEHSYKVIGSGTRMMIESRIKTPNWLESSIGGPAVSLTVDISGTNAHLNRVDAYHKGKGYAPETIKAALSFLKTNGVQSATGYIEHTNFASQSMAKKLGMRETEIKEHGSIWTKKL